MILNYPRTQVRTVDYFPDAHRLTPARAAALARMMADPQRSGRIPLSLQPAACTLNALAAMEMSAEIMGLRTGIVLEAAIAFLETRKRLALLSFCVLPTKSSR